MKRINLFLLLVTFVAFLGHVYAIKSHSMTLDSKDFQLGLKKGTLVDEVGFLTLSSSYQKILQTKELIAWKSIETPQGLLVATGNKGKLIFQANGSSNIETIETFSTEITALIMSDNGSIYAAGGDKGIVYQINLNKKKADIIAILNVDYIWDIKTHKNIIYVATGEGTQGGIYTVKKQKNNSNWKAERIFSSKDKGFLQIVIDNNHIFATTINDSVLFRLSLDGSTSKVLYESLSEEDISSFTVVENDIYLVTSGKKQQSKLIKGEGKTNFFLNYLVKIENITNKNIVQNILHSFYNEVLSSVIEIKTNKLLIGTAETGSIYEYDYSKEIVKKLHTVKSATILGFYKNVKGEILFVGGDKASVYQLKTIIATKGTFQSKIIDTKSTSQWGNVIIDYGKTKGNVDVFTKTANSRQDIRSRKWEKLTEKGKISSESGRFIQIKVTMKREKAKISKIARIHIYYGQKRKKIAIEGVSIGDKHIIASQRIKNPGNKTILSWKMNNFEKVNLIADVYYYHTTYSRKWLPYREDIVQNYVFLDESLFLEGDYHFKIVLKEPFDSPTNNNDLSLSKITTTYNIDYTPPELKDIKIEDKAITFNVQDKINIISNVMISINHEDFINIKPLDYIFDSPTENFKLNVDQTIKTVIVFMIDNSGNILLAPLYNNLKH